MHASPEDLSLSKDTDTANAVKLHLHVWVTIGIAQVGKVRPPRSILCITFDNDRVFIESVCQLECSL